MNNLILVIAWALPLDASSMHQDPLFFEPCTNYSIMVLTNREATTSYEVIIFNHDSAPVNVPREEQKKMFSEKIIRSDKEMPAT